MNFPPFWARGARGDFIAWRWSSNSAEEAQRLADEAARDLEERIRRGERLTKRGAYYPNRPFREEVLRQIRNSTSEIAGLITRNSYGCVVLNTARVMFVDVDLPEPEPPGLFKRLFGKPEPAPAAGNGQAAALAKVEDWTRRHPEWGWRIYRTRAGLRLLATHALFEPEAAASDGAFDALGADPLYRQLCRTQKCFRARLTPKPWRVGIHGSPDRWPWLTSKAEDRFRKWEAKYQSAITAHATCELIRRIGNDQVHPDVQLIIDVHDEATRAQSKLKLA